MRVITTVLLLFAVLLFALAIPETILTLFNEPEQLRVTTKILMAVSYIGVRIGAFIFVWVRWIR